MLKITVMQESGHEPRLSNCRRGFLKFGTVDIWDQIILCFGEAILCTLGYLTASLTSSTSPDCGNPNCLHTLDRCAPRGKLLLVESWCSRTCPGNHGHSMRPSQWWCCSTVSTLVCVGRWAGDRPIQSPAGSRGSRPLSLGLSGREIADSAICMEF